MVKKVLFNFSLVLPDPFLQILGFNEKNQPRTKLHTLTIRVLDSWERETGNIASLILVDTRLSRQYVKHVDSNIITILHYGAVCVEGIPQKNY